MESVFSRETRPSREASERREGANRSRDLSSRELSSVDLLRFMGEPSNEKGDERAATSRNEIRSEVAERQPGTIDALREKASSSREVERVDILSPLRETAVRNGEEKLKKYQQECIRWEDKDRDSTLKAFQDAFETTITEEKGAFLAKSRAKEGGGCYTNEININNGEIIGLHNFKRSTRDWHFSEVIFNQFQLIMQKANKDIASFDLKNWRGEKVVNKSTRSTVNLFLPAETNNHTFEKDSPGFIALAGTQAALSKFYLLVQHQKAFGQKEVTSITVKRQSYGNIPTIQINYRYA